ncbi:MAG: indolepyruvate oxidoreductase subunit beta [Clostridia bacterium]|nr:indolepyruvate oxidoreductase subunit beta [Clostridiales bacterium]MBR2614238.1 indolepyruvate oxidoreductase subunit beta [Clostridia bacterium]
MNILIVGVGGQGTLLTSRVLGKYAELKGFDCKLSEVHGMAQRGGSVVTHVRFGEKVFSPIIWEGSADIILSFEKLEALRAVNFLKKDGIILVNDEEIYPMPVITGKVKYPDGIKESLESVSKNLFFINALELAKKAGSSKAVNVVMIGALAKKMNFDFDTMIKAIELSVPSKFVELNKLALKLGYDA